MPPSAIDLELQADISAIDEKRNYLKQIIDITKALECMQESLNAVLILGVSSKELPREAVNLFSALSDNMRNLPVKKIKQYQENLEKIIKAQLKKIMGFSGVDLESDEAAEVIFLSSDASEPSPLELLEEFKKTAQTAVSLRVLLKNRGVSTPGTTIPVAKEEIHKHLKHLDNQEKQQREKIKTKVREMQADMDRMIDNPNYPDAMKQTFLNVKNNLEHDLKHIESGGNLQELSFVAETTEIIDSDFALPEEAAGEQSPPESRKKQSGFLDTTDRWLNSSWDTSWDQAKKESDSK